MFAYVGGYTTPDRDGRSNGINVFRIDAPDGPWTRIQHVGGLENPSLFTLNRAGTRLYSVHGGRNLLSAFAIDRASGRLTLLNQIDCRGSNPVDSALDPAERTLVVANYGTGAVAAVTLRQDGALGEVAQLVPLPGTPGPDPKEQASSHPHAVIFDPAGRFVIVPDKGFDRTFLFRCEDGRLAPADQPFLPSAPGAAPRHAVFHPSRPVLYVNNELDSTVTAFDWREDRASERQVIATRVPGYRGRNTTAEIAASADGRFLYVSNRGQDDIARFAVASDGGLTLMDHTPTGGRKPRFFTLGPDGGYLYAANQDSDDITVFRRDRATGALTRRDVRIEAGSPSAISFVDA